EVDAGACPKDAEAAGGFAGRRLAFAEEAAGDLRARAARAAGEAEGLDAGATTGELVGDPHRRGAGGGLVQLRRRGRRCGLGRTSTAAPSAATAARWVLAGDAVVVGVKALG